MKKFLMALSFAAMLAGCGSSVPLSDVSVEDKSGSAVPALPASTADASATNKGGVTPVDIGKSAQDGPGPVGVAPVVYFDYDSFIIKPDDQSVIEGHARFLKADPKRKVVLQGNTDERGGREYNLALGQKRAEAVRRALVLLGVPDAQMEAVSFGKEKPAVPGDDEAAFAKNRRVEFSYR